MKLYKDNGYIDCSEIMKAGYTFNIIIGARGTGKTYGFGKWLLIDHDYKIIYMRRTSAEIDIASSAEFNVFSALSENTGIDIHFERAKFGKKLLTGEELRGYALPLSTFSNARGFDANNIDFLFFDEFVPEHTRHSRISEADTFFNAYETMNRNRELSGRDPIRCILCANSNNLDNDLFRALGIVNIVSKLSARNIPLYNDPGRDLMVINISASPISQAKRDTALYRLTGGSTSFDQMALGNEFNDLAEYQIRSAALKGARPLWQIGSLIIYRLADGSYYGSGHLAGTPKIIYEDTQTGRDKFNIERGDRLVKRYRNGKLTFETPSDEVTFRNICKL